MFSNSHLHIHHSNYDQTMPYKHYLLTSISVKMSQTLISILSPEVQFCLVTDSPLSSTTHHRAHTLLTTPQPHSKATITYNLSVRVIGFIYVAIVIAKTRSYHIIVLSSTMFAVCCSPESHLHSHNTDTEHSPLRYTPNTVIQLNSNSRTHNKQSILY